MRFSQLKTKLLLLACQVLIVLVLTDVTRPVTAAEPRIEKDVAYGTAGGQNLQMDVFRPQGFAGKRPGVALIHGGGWSAGDKGFYYPLGQWLARKGYVAFSVNYRLAPAFHYPAQVDDVQRAVRFVRAHAAEYNVDPDRLAALGDSAGGHLSLVLGTQDTRDNGDASLAAYSSRVQCVVDFYGPTVLMTPFAKGGGSEEYASKTLRDFLGKTQKEDPALYRDASPLYRVDGRSAPTLMITGGSDDLVQPIQSEMLYNALRAAKVDATLAVIYKQGHAFLRPEDPGVYGGMIEAFLNRYLTP